MSEMIKVFLVDDQALVRSGFRMLIDAEDGIEVVGEAADGAAAVDALHRTAADLPSGKRDIMLGAIPTLRNRNTVASEVLKTAT